jgi:hypothetical protein
MNREQICIEIVRFWLAACLMLAAIPSQAQQPKSDKQALQQHIETLLNSQEKHLQIRITNTGYHKTGTK